MPHDYVVCSLCSSRDHRHNNCISNFEKFINCSGDHTTISMSCPINKTIRDQRKANFRPKIFPSYAAATRESPSNFYNNIKTMLKRTSIDKIMQCVVLSIFSKYNGPDDFSTTINNIFKSNNLLKLQHPSPPPTCKIFSLFSMFVYRM